MAIFEKLASFLTGLNSSKELRPYEQMVLLAWKDTLARREKDILEEQLRATKFVQRQAGDAKVVFYYRHTSSCRTFVNVKPDQNVATVVLRPADPLPKQYLKVKVYVHRGRLFSLEFPKRPMRYLELHGMEMQSLRVYDVATHVSLS